MILCHCCSSENGTNETYVVSLYPLFTYYDAVLCETCISNLADMMNDPDRFPIRPEFEDWVREVDAEFPPETGFYWSRYDEIVDSITTNPNRDEKECPHCGGIMVWDVEEIEGTDENGEPNLGDVIHYCINCKQTDPPCRKSSFEREYRCYVDL